MCRVNLIFSLTKLDNPGWVGDILCLLALSLHGMSKEAILRILQLRGYVDDLEVSILF